jgi:hydroxymethylpyrimidine pyrophosphatase-like HAD family hydrolase
MDCIGKNGALIGAKSLGFDKSKTTLDKDVSHYFTLISILSNQYNMQLKDNSFYLIAREPSDIDSDNHKIWESVNNNNFISVIDPEQSDEVADKIIQKEATLFI